MFNALSVSGPKHIDGEERIESTQFKFYKYHQVPPTSALFQGPTIRTENAGNVYDAILSNVLEG